MKTNQTNSKSIISSILNVFLILLTTSYASFSQNESNKYIVAAYVWPSCHDEPMSREKLWSEGIGEWEMIQKGDKRFDGHYQPRIPLWGYKPDDDPKAWEQKIDAALSHGINTFIFDWYWYDEKPFLEEAVDSGFLGAANNEKANFYLMWANHDVPGNMWNYHRYKNDSLLWIGEVDWKNYKIIVDRVINQYFSRPNYLKIDGKPVFSIYSLTDFIQSFNGIMQAREALDYFREQVNKAGYKGLHLQAVGRDIGDNDKLGIPALVSGKFAEGTSIASIVSDLGLNSVTTYNMANRSVVYVKDYIWYGEIGRSLWTKWDDLLDVPFFPQVSVGWDDTPRRPYKGAQHVCHFHNTPESFGALLQKAKEFDDNHSDQPKLVIINAWNEWVEGSYLEPDMLNGYGYLEAVKKVMSRKYD